VVTPFVTVFLGPTSKTLGNCMERNGFLWGAETGNSF
jgi:hypothetical protein